MNSVLTSLFVLFFSGTTLLHAQTDTVLIGDSPDADFTSLISFIASQSNQTLTDTVVARVLPGNYAGDYELMDLEGFPLVIEGFYPEPDSVLLIPTGIYFDIHDVDNIIFKNIFFRAESAYNNNLVDMGYSGNASFINCKFETFDTLQDGAVDFRYSNEVRFENCVVLKGEVSTNTGYVYLTNNVFYGLVDISGANICYDNVFFNEAGLMAGEYWDNVFHDKVRFKYHGVNFHHNLCYGEVRSSFDDNITLHSNVIHGRVNLNGGNNYTLYNNHFFDVVDIVYLDQPTLKVISNNFGPESRLECMPWTIEWIANNNFSQNIHFTFGNFASVTGNIKYNNYWPEQGTYGTNRHHLDPMYFSNDSLLPTNPMIVGQAGYVWSSVSIDEDILGVPRSQNSCIGANEYCMNTDSVFITCGQTVGSRLCSFPDSADLIIEPAEYVANLTHDFPMLTPPVSTTFYFTDAVSGITDTLYVGVDSLHISSQSFLETSCGIPVKLLEYPLFNYYNASINISWTPEEGITESLPYEWWATINESTTYHFNIEHEWCGSFDDSIQVFVNDIPWAYGETDVFTSDGEINFYNLSECTNEVLWDFGDGFQSTEENPTHIYTNPGIFYWTLTASSDGLSDTYTSVVEILNTVSTKDHEGKYFDIFPNPADESFSIVMADEVNVNQDVSIFDLNGKTIFKGNIRKRITIDSADWTPGFYVVEVGDLRLKLVVN